MLFSRQQRSDEFIQLDFELASNRRDTNTARNIHTRTMSTSVRYNNVGLTADRQLESRSDIIRHHRVLRSYDTTNRNRVSTYTTYHPSKVGL